MDHFEGPGGAYEALIEGSDNRFNALLGGGRFRDDKYLYMGKSGNYWSATEGSPTGGAWEYVFNSDFRQVYLSHVSRLIVLSCRYLKDLPSNGTD